MMLNLFMHLSSSHAYYLLDLVLNAVFPRFSIISVQLPQLAIGKKFANKSIGAVLSAIYSVRTLLVFTLDVRWIWNTFTVLYRLNASNLCRSLFAICTMIRIFPIPKQTFACKKYQHSFTKMLLALTQSSIVNHFQYFWPTLQICQPIEFCI